MAVTYYREEVLVLTMILGACLILEIFIMWKFLGFGWVVICYGFIWFLKRLFRRVRFY